MLQPKPCEQGSSAKSCPFYIWIWELFFHIQKTPIGTGLDSILYMRPVKPILLMLNQTTLLLSLFTLQLLTSDYRNPIKKDFISLHSKIKSSASSIIISGPLPVSHLLYLNDWLKNWCLANNVDLTDNCDCCWGRPALFKRDGLHLSRNGTSVLANNRLLCWKNLTSVLLIAIY